MFEKIMESLKPKVINITDEMGNTEKTRRAIALLMLKLNEKGVLSADEIEQMLDEIQKG